MDYKYVITSSPHIRSNDSIRKVMFSVLLALMPATIMGCVLFGFRALIIVLLSVGSAIGAEYLFNLIMGREQTINDLSACVTGLLIALSVPSTIPIWMPIIGSFFAIIVVKQLFGGLGNNFLNPALAARVFLSMAWPKEMTVWVKPFSEEGISLFGNVDISQIASTVTPLTSMQSLNYTFTNFNDLLWGNIGGCIGETSTVLLLIGGAYLLIRKVISWEIPVTFIGALAILSYIFPTSGTPVTYMLAQVLSGGLIISAFFMATDYSTTPITRLGKFIFGLGCGVITFLMRKYSAYPEGVTYAILFMNLLTVVLDYRTRPRRFGKGGVFYGKRENTGK